MVTAWRSTVAAKELTVHERQEHGASTAAWRATSYWEGMAASQPNKPTMKEDGEDEMAGWWEKAVKKLREEDAAKLKKKKEEELEKERKRKQTAANAMRAREQALMRKVEEAQKKRQHDFEERTMKLWAIAAEKEERDNQIFIERVVKEAHLIRKREEEEEEERKKKKGKGPCSTQ
ncbi:uncharacterized protein [Aegilops tauschii subsp. strangulata]|uniref:uncharacterized protein n=1 Tax=Aegilops tauschii subsp. strangulata TaxID=200361 RepID=UPI003CC8BE59